MRSLPRDRWHTRSGARRGAQLQERLSDGQCEVLSPLENREKPNRIELLEKIVSTSRGVAKYTVDGDEHLRSGSVSSAPNASFARPA